MLKFIVSLTLISLAGICTTSFASNSTSTLAAHQGDSTTSTDATNSTFAVNSHHNKTIHAAKKSAGAELPQTAQSFDAAGSNNPDNDEFGAD